MKLVVLTSTAPRHLAFAEAVSQEHDVVRCICEPKSFDPSLVGKNSVESSILEKWFSDRDRAERDFFKSSAHEFEQRHGDIIINFSIKY